MIRAPGDGRARRRGMHIEQGTSMAAASADRRRWLVLAIVTSGGFIAVLDAFIVNVAIPSIQHGLHASSGEIEFVIAAYTLSYAVLLITGGRLGDIYGRKRMFMLGMGAFTVASAGCGLAPTATVLILCRALQRVGAAVMYPQVLSIIQVTFADQSRNVALGIFAGSIGVASIAGQLVGGVLIGADLFGMAWRPVFLVNIPIGVLAILASAVVLRHRRAERPPSLDLFGVVLATAFLLLLLVPLVEGRDAGWPWWTAASLGLSAPALVLFIRYERRREARDASPLISVRLFRLRSVSAGVLVALCFFGGNAGLFFTLAV